MQSDAGGPVYTGSSGDHQTDGQQQNVAVNVTENPPPAGAPEDTVPEDTVPEDTVPEDTVPEDADSENVTPEDADSENVTPEDAGIAPEALKHPDRNADISPEPASDNSVNPTVRGDIPPGPAEKAFRALASLGLLFPVLVLLVQTGLGLDARSLWFSDEVRHGAAYEAMRQSGEWLILTLNGLPYPDKPPFYFWFLYGLDQIPQLDPPRLFLAAAALSALLLAAATWLLARALGYDKRQSLAASLILLTTFSFLGISHYARMDLLFAVFITLSHICLFRGWIKKSAPLWLALGFIFAALSCLVKGPLGLALPLLSSFFFLLWRGDFRRAGGRDGALGFGLMLLILLAWVSLVLMQEGGRDYLSSMFGRHMLERALDAWHHKQPWWFYLVNLPLAWLPWTLLFFFLPWERLPGLLKNAVRARSQAPGRGWAWISLVSGVVALSLLSGKVGIYTLPLYPFLAILTAQGLLSLGPRRSRGFFLTLAVLLFLLAILFGLAGIYSSVESYLPESMRFGARFDMSKPAAASVLHYIQTLKGLPLLAGVCLIFSLILTKGCRRSWPGGSLLVVTLFFTVLIQPLAMVTAPSMDTLMSPRPQADIMRNYAAENYHITTFSVTAGTYTYYMGGVVDEVNDWDILAERLAAHPQIMVATRLNRWKEWQEKPELHPESFRVVDTQWIAERQYVLLARDGQTQPPAAPDSLNALPPNDAVSPLESAPDADADAEQPEPGTEPESARPEAQTVPNLTPGTMPEHVTPDPEQTPVETDPELEKSVPRPERPDADSSVLPQGSTQDNELPPTVSF